MAEPTASFLQGFLPYRLNRLSEAASLEVRVIYRDLLGITRPEWRVLAALADLGHATATQIGAHSAQHKTKVSRAVFALEARRWLSRSADPNDRRSESLTLTETGQRAYRQLLAPLQKREAEIMMALSDADRAALLQGLTALEQALLPRDQMRDRRAARAATRSD